MRNLISSAFVLASAFSGPAYSHQTLEKTNSFAIQWFFGGTLREATASQWRNATYENRLATASRWLVDYWGVERTNLITQGDFNNARRYADLLVVCIDELAAGANAGDRSARELAGLCMYVLEHI